MAQNEINQYDEIDNNNVDISGTTVVQNLMYPAMVPVAFRKLMGALKRTFRSDLFRLRDSADQTKLAAFDLSSLTTATTRTFIVPNKNGTIATISDVTSGVAQASAKRNLWVNPDFSLSQENGNTLGTSSGFFPADQIALYFLASTAAMSVQRVQVRSLANSLNQVEFKTTTAKASLGANDFVTLTQPIEGSSFAEAGFGTANAKPYAFRFQITAPAGTYHWHFANSAANRHCSVPFVVAGGEANTAVVKEVVVPADTGGTWLTADGVIGLTAELVLAAGATLTGGTASTWGGTFYLAASANFNTLGSTANIVRLADVGIKKDDAVAGYGAWAAGTDAVYRGERYYQRSYQPGSAIASSTTLGMVYIGTAVAGQGAVGGGVLFPIEMAKPPASIQFYDGVGAASRASYTDVSANTNFGHGETIVQAPFNISTKGFVVKPAGLTSGRNSYIHYVAPARLT